MNASRYQNRQGVEPISWLTFHCLTKGLAQAVASYHPQLILPIGRGGYYPGTLIAHLLQVEIAPIRLSRRINDQITWNTPRWITEPPPAVWGQRVLIVDEICDTGETLKLVKENVEARGPKSVQSAVLYAHSWSASLPDYIGLISDALILNPWDREIYVDESFVLHPEYAEALKMGGFEPGPDHLIHSPAVNIAKGGKD
jgi:hypothetical protein